MQSFVHPVLGVRFFTIDGVLPVDGEWAKIRAEGSGVNVVRLPEASSTLAPLREQLPWLSHLAINSSTCRDLALLETATNLRWLAVGGDVSVGSTITGLQQLEFFGGPVDAFPGILDHSSLRELRFDWPGARPPSVGAPATTISIQNARRLRDVPDARHSTALRSLTVHGARVLSLRALARYVRLESLTLDHCAEVTEVATLGRLPLLNRLVLEDCPRLDLIAELDKLSAEVQVIGRNPFPKSFRDRVRADKWSFPPGRRFLPAEPG
jgi:hypothetical protein